MMRALPILASIVFLFVTAPVLAQDGRPWTYDAELGASLFFGASEQAAVLARSKLEWNDPRREFSLSAGYDYGEAKDADGASFVSKRSWIVETSADYLPGGRISPFVFATAEGSFERQIDNRTSGGAGAKYTFVDNDQSRADVSLAALVERTSPRASPGTEAEVSSIGRWSGRIRYRQSIGEEVLFDLISFYRPKMGDFDDYTLDVNATLTYQINTLFGLRLSLVDKYDSLAKDRGAADNNDGRLYFSVLASVR